MLWAGGERPGSLSLRNSVGRQMPGTTMRQSRLRRLLPPGFRRQRLDLLHIIRIEIALYLFTHNHKRLFRQYRTNRTLSEDGLHPESRLPWRRVEGSNSPRLCVENGSTKVLGKNYAWCQLAEVRLCVQGEWKRIAWSLSKNRVAIWYRACRAVGPCCRRKWADKGKWFGGSRWNVRCYWHRKLRAS